VSRRLDDEPGVVRAAAPAKPGQLDIDLMPVVTMEEHARHLVEIEGGPVLHPEPSATMARRGRGDAAGALPDLPPEADGEVERTPRVGPDGFPGIGGGILTGPARAPRDDSTAQS